MAAREGTEPTRSEHTLHSLSSYARSVLSAAGVATPALDARLLIAHALGCAPALPLFAPEQPVEPGHAEAVLALVRRRAAREPLSHITGRREFYGLEFLVNANVLDPRPDSETLVEAVLERIEDKTQPCRVLDLGTGSGCLLLSVLSALPNATGVGVDISAKALEVAGKNIESLGFAGRVFLLHGCWLQAISGKFDIILANPPYIDDDEMEGLMPEVRLYEPQLALRGGKDGLDSYREIAKQLPEALAPGGIAALETGYTQADAVAQITTAAGLEFIGKYHDLAGMPRCIIAGAPQLSINWHVSQGE